MPLASRVTNFVLSDLRTWLALAVVIGLEAAFFGWFRPSLPMMIAALALGGVAVVAWPLMFVRSESFARRFYEVPEAVQADQEVKLQALATDFDEFEFAQGSAQLRMLREKFENLSEIMKRRLNAGELTYARYLGMAEQVYLSALDNLNEVAVALRSVSTIDPDYIQSRLRELSSSEQGSGEQHGEFAALQERHSLYDDQQQRVMQLIAQNETAMTVLDKTATALAEVKTGKGQASMDAEAAIAELERLAKQAGAYATDD